MHRFRRKILDIGNFFSNLFSRTTGLTSQTFDLGSDHRKPLAGFAGSGRLNRGIKSQQIRLSGNTND